MDYQRLFDLTEEILILRGNSKPLKCIETKIPGDESIVQIKSAIDLAWQIILLRGGPTSGNWAHSGRPGKKGGSGSGGGFRRIGVKDGKAGRGKIKQAARQTRAKDERSKGGGIKADSRKIPKGMVGRARSTVDEARGQRDKNLRKVFAVDREIQKANIANERAATKFAKADERALKSLRASDKHLEKINKIAEREIEAGRLSPWARRESSEVLRPLLEKQKQLDAKDKVNSDKVNEANRKLRETSKDLDRAISKKESLPQGLQSTSEVMGAYQKETESASKVLFQHNLNEGKRARDELINKSRVTKKGIKSLERREEKVIIEMDRLSKLSEKLDPNSPEGKKISSQLFRQTQQSFEIDKEIRKLKQGQLSSQKDLLQVSNPTKLTASPGSQRDPQVIAKNGWNKGREGFESLVSNDVVPAGSLVRFNRTNEDRSFHLGGAVSRVSMSDFAGPNTMVHELGHMAENYNPRLLNRSIEWRNSRTKGENLKQLADVTGNHGYDSREKTKADKFFDAYIGKDYGNRASEVFSMGIERMYKDPLGFAEQDPDMFDFIYAQARTP
jgi:hypothetical protein